MGDISKDFNRAEFACKCGCGFDKIDVKVIAMCQRIRDALGSPIRINSACRCNLHNKNVGGVPGSYHTKGLAADLSCAEGSQRIQAVIKALYDEGLLPQLAYCRRYIEKNFVHIDAGHARSVRFVKG